MIQVRSLDHFVLRVQDLERSLAFYRDVLGLGVDGLDAYRAGTRPFVSLRVGEQLLDLVPDAAYSGPSDAAGFLHFCVTLGGDFAESLRGLRDRGVVFLQDEPTERAGARGVGLSVYVRDPDGYVVELKEH